MKRIMLKGIVCIAMMGIFHSLVLGQDIVKPAPKSGQAPSLPPSSVPSTPPSSGPGYRNSQIPAPGQSVERSPGAIRADSLRAYVEREVNSAITQADKELQAAIKIIEATILSNIEDLNRQQLLSPAELKQLQQDLNRQLKQLPQVGRSLPKDTTSISIGRNRLLLIAEDGSLTIKKDTETKPKGEQEDEEDEDDEDDDDDDDDRDEENGRSNTRTNNNNDDGKGKQRRPGDVQTRFIGLDLGINTWMHNGSLNLPPQYQDLELRQPNSINVLLHFFPTRVNLVKQHLHLRTALTFDFHNYKFLNPITLTPRVSTFEYKLEENMNFSRNKLAMTVMQVPLMLQFTAKNRRLSRCFRVAVGGYGGIVVSSQTKQRSSQDGRVKIKDDYNIDRLRYGLTARVGYGVLELYANYSLNPLFIEGRKAPELYPFAIGVNLLRL
jgi:hypothetical protein